MKYVTHFCILYLGIFLSIVHAGFHIVPPDSMISNSMKIPFQLQDDPSSTDYVAHDMAATQAFSGSFIELIANQNDLIFYFDVNLQGGQFVCNRFEDAVGGFMGTELNITFLDEDLLQRCKSDLQIFVTHSNSSNVTVAELLQAQMFGGNDVGNIGGIQDTNWPSSFSMGGIVDPPPTCKSFAGPINLDDGFNTVCVASTCTNGFAFTTGYCTNPEAFRGQFIISKFSTPTLPVADIYLPVCDRIHFPFYEDYDSGKIELISNTSNLWVNFDLTYPGGHYQCIPIVPAVATSEKHEFLINYLDQLDGGRYIFDPMVIFAFNGNATLGEYFGGNLEMPIARTALGFWRASYATPHVPNTCYSFEGFLNITAGFDAICIMNTCTTNGQGSGCCQDMSHFVGSIIITGFSTTTSLTKPVTTNPVCLAGSTSPTKLPTRAPSYDPTCPPIVTLAPVIKPTHFPTHSHHPSTKPTHFPTHIHPPTPTHSPTFCECVCEDHAYIPPTHMPTSSLTTNC